MASKSPSCRTSSNPSSRRKPEVILLIEKLQWLWGWHTRYPYQSVEKVLSESQLKPHLRPIHPCGNPEHRLTTRHRLETALGAGTHLTLTNQY
ncbi:hypothetical protein Hanom_Chr17g01588121 [Helianthus anomalus]